jgi:hypothetical protein
MKIYISGKITGLKPETAERFFQFYVIYLKDKYPNAMIVNPMKLPHNHNHKWNSYIKEDIRALTHCTHIYMISNWWRSKGAWVEFMLSKILKIKRVK